MGLGNVSNASVVSGIKHKMQDMGSKAQVDPSQKKVKTAQNQTALNWGIKDPIGSQSISLGEQKLIEAIEKANKALQGANTRIEFHIHEKTNSVMVKVINSETDELIREIPPEKILDMAALLWELAGIIIDERI